MPASTRRRLAAAGAVASALALAACGGGAGEGAPAASLPGGARLVPADTAVFITVNTDFASDQWQAVEDLVARFPSGGKAMDDLLARIEGDGISFESDVKPALGPELDLALLDIGAEEPDMVLLTRPADAAAFETLLGKGDGTLVWSVSDGWYVVSDSQALVDQALAADRTLADDEQFAGALGDLHGDPLARLYVDGDALVAAMEQAPTGSAANPLFSAIGVGTLDAIAVGITAEARGARVQGVVTSSDAPAPETFSSDLANLAPADALVYVGFGGLDSTLKEAIDLAGKQAPELDTMLAQAELALGVSVENDLLPIFAGPGALWVRAGVPIPEITIVLSPDDIARALVTLDKLVGGIGALAALSGDGSPPVTTGTESIAGITAKTLQLPDGVTLYYAAVGEHLVLTTAVKGIADVAAPGATLTSDAVYGAAVEAAGVPEQTAGLMYVNVGGALDVLDALGAIDPGSPSDQEALENLRALDYLVAYATGEPGKARFEGFLGIG